VSAQEVKAMHAALPEPQELAVGQSAERAGPGAIYLAQTLQFEHPVRIGAEVEVRVEVKAIDAETRHAVRKARPAA
jgi:acyl dehydratase